jgi:hypothetical protein
MAATLVEICQLANMSSFKERVFAAAVKAAVAVAAETPDPSERSRLRRALSARILENREGIDYSALFAIAVATNPSITQASPDNDIQFTVNSMWDAVAGAEPPPAP